MSSKPRKSRYYPSGATRDSDEGKVDYEGYLSSIVLERYGRYMLAHQWQSDGNRRASDNWQKGMPLEAFMKSNWRHFMDLWLHHRGLSHLAKESLEDACCAIIFNTSGYLHETLKASWEAGAEDA